MLLLSSSVQMEYPKPQPKPPAQQPTTMPVVLPVLPPGVELAVAEDVVVDLCILSHQTIYHHHQSVSSMKLDRDFFNSSQNSIGCYC